MASLEARVSQKELGWRHFVLGKAALDRFWKEVDGSEHDPSVYDVVADADKIQLENPKGKERWEVVVFRYGKGLGLRQCFYSDAGQAWQVGRTFRFDVEVLQGVSEPKEEPGEEEVPFLTDEEYFKGLVDALAHWPLAKWYITPLY